MRVGEELGIENRKREPEARLVRGLRVRTLDIRNSGDTAGDRHRVVGYGAYALR